MGVPHITSFFCCMGLEVGAKCVGFLHLLTSLALMIYCSVFAAGAGELVGTVEDMDRLYSTWYKIAVGVAVVSVVHVALALTLLISVFKRNTVGLRVWVCVMSVLCAGALLCVLGLCAAHGMSGTGSDIFISFLEGFIFFAVVCYCILCVYSYYLLLKSSEDMAGPKQTDY